MPYNHLRLVWPPAQPLEVDDAETLLLAALRDEGWREVDTEDLRSLPPDSLCIVNGYRIDGIIRFFLKDAPKLWLV